LRTVLWQWAGSDLTNEEVASLQSLQEILETEKNSTLQSLITQTELLALKTRIDALIKDRSFPLPSTDWPAIPWPAF
jgi:hypothetical protein